MKIGDFVKVKNNLEEEMNKIGFEKECIDSFVPNFVGTEQEIFNIWHDDDSNTDFATVDLGCEIPLQCLELI